MASRRSWPPRKFLEVWFSPLDEGVAPFLGFFRHVVEQRRISGELLHPRLSVQNRIEGAFQKSERKRALLEHFLAPLHGLGFQISEWHYRVDESHLERLLRIVLPTEIPDLPRPLLSDDRCQVRRAEAAIEAANLGSGLAKSRVVGGDREIANDVQDVSASNRITGNHRHHGLGK